MEAMGGDSGRLRDPPLETILRNSARVNGGDSGTNGGSASINGGNGRDVGKSRGPLLGAHAAALDPPARRCSVCVCVRACAR
eukprot:3419798-Rhodomonas_salina.2